MKILVQGHRYQVDSFEGENPQIIQFIHKEPKKEGSAELRTINDGTTNEELIRVLIDRMTFLNNKFHSYDNDIVILRLKEALLWLGKRTTDRMNRGVEGKARP